MSLITKIRHFLHPIQGEIWCLHRVVSERSIFPSNRELEVTPDYLKQFIEEYRKRGFAFVPIDDIVTDLGSHPCDLRKKKRVNISFDDGFRDVYENAFPLFKQLNVPFTIYLTSDFPEGVANVWWIQLEQFVAGDVSRFEKLAKEAYLSEKNMRDVIHERTGMVPDHRLCKSLSLSWEQLQEMVDSGLCTVGSHTMAHPGLTRISNDDMHTELTQSKEIIEKHLSIHVRHFSYPHSMENEGVQKAVRQAGYLSAALGYGGTVRKGDNPYRLNRKYIVQP